MLKVQIAQLIKPEVPVEYPTLLKRGEGILLEYAFATSPSAGVLFELDGKYACTCNEGSRTWEDAGFKPTDDVITIRRSED